MINLDRLEEQLDEAIAKGEITDSEARAEMKAAQAENEYEQCFENRR